MAQTQEQWYNKLKSWVPGWWFSQNEKYNRALFMGLAKVFSQLESDRDAHILQTFIAQSEDPFLSAHGDERRIERESGESDESYSSRIRNLTNAPDLPAIENQVNSFLLVGPCRIVEHQYEGAFMDCDSFFDRQDVLTDIYYNTFSVIIPNQGDSAEADQARQSIAASVNAAKALGTLYQLVETDL